MGVGAVESIGMGNRFHRTDIGIVLHPDDYLDIRQPTWLDAELEGAVWADRDPKTGVKVVLVSRARPDLVWNIKQRLALGQHGPLRVVEP
jgi:hypothetical protein